MLPLVILGLVSIIVLLVVLVVTRRVKPNIVQVRQEVKMGLGAPCISSSSSTVLYSDQACDVGLTCDDGGFGTDTGICKVSIGQSCTTVADCSSDARICSFGVCAVKPYGGLGQPPDGTTCDPGLTIAPDGKCRKISGAACAMDTDCVSDICGNGVCIAQLPNGAFCDRDKECVDNLCNTTWLMGSCQIGGHPCVSDVDCVSGSCIKTNTQGICQNPMIPIGTTGSICNGVIPCDSGLVCAKDLDLPSSYPQCLPPILDWPSSQTCIVDGVGCPRSMVCRSGVCVFDSPDPTACIADGDCPIGFECDNGVCKYTPQPSRTGTTFQVWRWRLPERGTVSFWEPVPLTLPNPPLFFSVSRDTNDTYFLIGDGTNLLFLEDGEIPIPVSITYDTSAISPPNVPLVSAVVETIKVAVVGGVAVTEFVIRTTYSGNSRLILYQQPVAASYTLPLPSESDLLTDPVSSSVVITQSHSGSGGVEYLSGGGQRYTSTFLVSVGTRTLLATPVNVGTGSYFDDNAHLDVPNLTYGSTTVSIPGIVNVFYNGANGVGVVGPPGGRFPYYFQQTQAFPLPARINDSSIMSIAPTVGPDDPYVYVVST